MSRWYTRSELAFRLSLYIVMAPLAGAFGGLLASGILKLDHFGGLRTWRMIFAIEGIITCLLSVIAFFTLTDRPATAKWLSQDEKDMAIARVKAERIAATEVLDKIDRKKFFMGLLSPATIATSFIFLLNNITVQGLAFFAPTIKRASRDIDSELAGLSQEAIQMSVEQIATSLPIISGKSTPQHPLGPLTASEIKESSRLIKSAWPSDVNIQFKSITLQEPQKAELLHFLAAEHSGQATPTIERRSFVVYYLRNTDKLHEAVVSLSAGKVESNLRLGPNVHSNADGDEIIAVERIALEDEKVQAEIKKLQLPEGTVVISDPWIYGIDNTIKEPSPYKVQPPNEYIHEAQELRTDLKPLNVVQPEGASFKVSNYSEQGHNIEWQKWTFKVGFNQREGMVLYDVHYDGRPLFYRLSLSDMNIPYADPRHPFHKKAAFDLGDAGAGIMANNLQLGCDCLGSIHYLSAVLNDDKGEPLDMPNCVCIHEQDNGIGWKHTNYRTGRAAVVRNRELVLQSIITVSNYEYILAFMFNQAGEVTYEVRATGILSTQPIDEGISVPFGTVVHPGVLAVHHQHIFSLRVDPMIDGPLNRVVYDEAHAMPRSDFNPHGVGYTVSETPITTSGGYDLDYDVNRTFKIQNSAIKNPINGKPVAYKIHAPPFQKMLADPQSYHHKRAEFADHNIYVTSYRDDELYAGGKYTNQSRGGTGVRSWADRKDDVQDQDIVVWVQFGINHVPRIEDFPVMPCEILKVSLKPVNFFERNPAIDVPPSTQTFNKSVLASVAHQQEVGEAVVGGDGECCVRESSKL
ncbi:putative Copper amine oxidase 1 [Glarea lozoyensis 74030]|uniref:Amine oxidase n=1 Tax=Glarea lozoyensis (strain ATCC 74030 / MF5533) TaxID=1104152 RepID=H0EUR3_GLAL7|nr:putative Copper amine oxidase 1 [Glarea lozoyensis 74030]